jgi:enoyl-CoA hydratase/carnithine racemase
LGKPSVARINGIAAGGGNGWNLACDLAIAADHAKFVHIETKLGMVSAGGPAEWLPLVIGERRAREMLLTSEPVSANKALLWGLVNDVVSYNELDDAVAALCRKLIDRFPNSARRMREQLNYWRDLAWRATIEQDRDLLAAQFASDEAREGLRALAERREVDFRKLRLNSRPSVEDHLPLSGEAEGSREEIGIKKERSCLACGSKGFPASHQYCGHCGEKLI